MPRKKRRSGRVAGKKMGGIEAAAKKDGVNMRKAGKKLQKKSK